jgi:hypothetical protein
MGSIRSLIAFFLIWGWPLGSWEAGVPLHFYENYEKVLHAALDPQGAVRYSALKAHRAMLDQVLTQFETFPPALFAQWKPKDQAAFYINVYNARVIQTVVDHYPLRKLDEVPEWAGFSFPLLEGRTSLEQVERKIFEPPLEEPRACLALVKADQAGPPLRARPYYGAQLDSVLEEQAWLFFRVPSHFRIDRERNIVFLSTILQKHEQSFVKLYGATNRFSFLNPSQKAVLNFVSQHVKPRDRDYLVKTKNFYLRYLEDDRSLNDADGPGPALGPGARARD